MRKLRAASVHGEILALAALVTLLDSAAASAEGVKPIKALLVIGGCCHDYAAQKEILAKGLAARALR